MNAPNNQQAFQVQNDCGSDFVRARNAFLDRFADLESAISKLLVQSGSIPSLNEPFGNRLKAFRDLENATLIAKCRIAQRNQIADGIAKILPIRNDLVHSRMHVTDLGGVPVALFVNSQLTHDPDAPARILTNVRLDQLSQKMAQFAEKIGTLRQPISKPSSPPPPSPGAASGP